VLVVHADGVQVLSALADSCVDAVVTDPPWNRGKDYGSCRDDMDEESYVGWLSAVLADCGRVSRGPVAVFLGSTNGQRLGRLLRGTELEPQEVLAWQRSPGVHETVAVLGRRSRPSPPPHLARRARAALTHAAEPDDTFGHPCPKPVSALQSLIELVSPSGGTVLDPFMGVGTTLVAARHRGRAAIGVELEHRYCRVAMQRLAPDRAQSEPA
jgi:site-specific DNA-methyltransferase (adenine-specific)